MSLQTSRITRAATVGYFMVAMTASVVGAQTKAPPVLPRPAAGPAKVHAFPAISSHALPNGMRLAVVENHEMPLVSVRIGFTGGTFVGGSLADPAGKEGAWNLLMVSLREGAASRTGAQLTDAIADLGATFLPPRLAAPSDLGFTAAKPAWKPALQLVADMLAQPTLPADGVQRLQTQYATALGRLPAPQAAQRVLLSNLYGGSHQFSRFATPASVRAVTRADLVSLQTTYLRPQNAVIVVVGDITPDEARTAVMAAFANWPNTGSKIDPSIVAMPEARTTPTTIYLRDVPGALTSSILSGQLLPGRDHPDAVALEAMASVLGVGPATAGSRFYTAFRVNKGLAYSPFFQFERRSVGESMLLVGIASVAPALTGTAITEWMNVVRETKSTRPLTPEEMEFSRSAMIGGLPATMETVDAVATQVLDALKGRVREPALNDRVRRLAALTLPEVRSAAAKYLDVDHLVFVVVGDRSKIEEPLKATGIPVVIVP